MRVLAFQGVRYASAAGPAGALAGPPFDQIDDTLRDRLHRTPYHFSHLTRPVPGEDGDPYARAARLHDEWRGSGALQRDPEPNLYPYALRLVDGRRRLGLCCLIGLEDPGSGIIRPHEQTTDKAVRDRLALLRATRVDLEPILLLSEDGGALDPLLEEDLAGLDPLATHRDADGNEHALFRIATPRRIARYRNTLTDCAALIADGHHRYRVAGLYRDEVGPEAGLGAACKMAVVTSLTSPGLSIDPIHRGFVDLPPLAAAAELTLDRQPWRGDSGAAFAAAIAAAGGTALGFWRHGGEPRIWRLDPERTIPGVLPAAVSLPVVQLHRLLLPALGLGPETATDGTIGYRSDPDRLWKQVASGELMAGVWLPPMDADAFAAAISDGGLLPPKSTRFLPKLVSGLVWSPHPGSVI